MYALSMVEGAGRYIQFVGKGGVKNYFESESDEGSALTT